MVRNSFSQNIWVSCFLSESAPFNSADGALENKYYSPQFSSLRFFKRSRKTCASYAFRYGTPYAFGYYLNMRQPFIVQVCLRGMRFT